MSTVNVGGGGGPSGFPSEDVPSMVSDDDERSYEEKRGLPPAPSTMIVPVSDALRACLKDPDFLRRLDGFIFQVREWQAAMESENYHEDSEHRYISTDDALMLVFGEDVFTREPGLDAHDLNDVMAWAAQAKDPESEDPGPDE